MFHLSPDELRSARLMVNAMPEDQALIKLLDQSNQVSVSDGQVEHGYAHATDVLGLVKELVARTEELFPGTFAEAHVLSAYAGALLHDSGRSIAVKDHDMHGAVISHKYLPELAGRVLGDASLCPRAFRQRVVFLVRKHRSDSWLYRTPEEKAKRRKELDGPDMAALLIADKLCGSEVRVTPAKLELLKQLRKLSVSRGLKRKFGLDRQWSLARINWGNPELIAEPAELLDHVGAILADKGIVIPTDLEIDPHDRVNGSIKHRVIEVFADDPRPAGKIKGTMLYRMKVDEKLAPQELVTGLDWWGDAFHTAAKAAKFLGFRFRIDFNGRTLQYSREAGNWVVVDSIQADGQPPAKIA